MKLDYIEQYTILHNSKDEYGTSGGKYLEEISLFINYLKPKVVLDYGCGKSVLVNKLIKKFPDIEFYRYDPAIKEISTLPVQKADLVINTDVLEHIPMDILPNVLSEISSITKNVFFVVQTTPAVAILPNGENAHCTLMEPNDWDIFIRKYFDLTQPLAQRYDRLCAFTTFQLPLNLLRSYYRIINKNYVEKYAQELVSLAMNKDKILKKYRTYNLLRKIIFLKKTHYNEKFEKYSKLVKRISNISKIIGI